MTRRCAVGTGSRSRPGSRTSHTSASPGRPPSPSGLQRAAAAATPSAPTRRHAVTLSVSQSVCHVSQSVTQSVRHAVSQTVMPSVMPSDSQSVTPSVRQAISQSRRQCVMPSVSASPRQSARGRRPHPADTSHAEAKSGQFLNSPTILSCFTVYLIITLLLL